MKKNYIFTYLDINSQNLIIFFVFWILMFVPIISLVASGFLAQVLQNLTHESESVQQHAVKVQKVLRLAKIVKLIIIYHYVIITAVLLPSFEITTHKRYYARIEKLIQFDDKMLELFGKNQIDSSTVESIKKNNSLLLEILNEHAGKPINFASWVAVLGLFLMFFILIQNKYNFFSKPIKLSLLLIVRVDVATSYLFVFLIYMVTIIVGFVFRPFFVQQFLLFFSDLTEPYKIQLLKNTRWLLMGSLVLNIVFPFFLGWIFISSQAIEIAQLNHLYELQCLFHNETQTILSELIEKQKLYLPDTVEYQRITELINLTTNLLEQQKLILIFFETKYSCSLSNTGLFVHRSLAVLRQLITIFFSFSLIVLMYRAYLKSKSYKV